MGDRKRNYSQAEQDELKARFQPVAARYRLLGWLAFAAAAPICLWLIAVTVFSVRGGAWLLVACGVSLIGFTVIALFTPKLICPGCEKQTDRGQGNFCPECGAETLGPGDWLRHPHCRTCDKTMRRGKNRHYTIRYCTHCGLLLDEKGV
ncbi:MAG TPA: hypothetical protein VGH19_01835 [Verrucomicrobiae bacterium]